MSFLTSCLSTPLRASRTLQQLSRPAVAAFHASPLRAALNESERDHPEIGAHNEAHKEDSVSKAKSGRGEWKSELASNSEQAVKYDKHDLSIEEMQKMDKSKNKTEK